ncbi:hypothetical protein HHI36_005097 [Cryptolaemus montrouzieri]|uniref:Uncharacterized protein n=1 Tax=Cryptolaemus montrouzieri TaxID=559131 RepID=A0ABD2NU13_9CUCU
MAYDLPRMTVAESLRVEDEDAAVDQGSASGSEDSDEYNASESEIDNHEMSPEWKNAALSLRLLESRARLRDRLSDVDPVDTPGPAGPAVNAIEQFWDFLFTPNIIQVIV